MLDNGFSEDQLSVLAQSAALAAALCAKSDTPMVDKEGCEHLFVVRWKENVSVCLLCRELVNGPNNYGLMIIGPEFEKGNPIGERG